MSELQELKAELEESRVHLEDALADIGLTEQEVASYVGDLIDRADEDDIYDRARQWIARNYPGGWSEVQHYVGNVRQTQRLINRFGSGFLGVPLHGNSVEALVRELEKNGERQQLEADIAQQQYGLGYNLQQAGFDSDLIMSVVTKSRTAEPSDIMPEFGSDTNQTQIDQIGDLMWAIYELQEQIIDLGQGLDGHSAAR